MWDEIIHTVPEFGKVDTSFGDFTIRTDHPPPGDRTGRAPEPFAIFLASIGACAASFVVDHLKAEGLPIEGLRFVQRQTFAGPDHTIPAFEIDIEVPADFPAEHRAALIEEANACTVKRVIEAGPAFRFTVREAGGS